MKSVESIGFSERLRALKMYEFVDEYLKGDAIHFPQVISGGVGEKEPGVQIPKETINCLLAKVEGDPFLVYFFESEVRVDLRKSPPQLNLVYSAVTCRRLLPQFQLRAGDAKETWSMSYQHTLSFLSIDAYVLYDARGKVVEAIFKSDPLSGESRIEAVGPGDVRRTSARLAVQASVEREGTCSGLQLVLYRHARGIAEHKADVKPFLRRVV